MSRPILVTGFTGLLGSHLTSLLRARGAVVVGVSRSAGRRCDLRDAGATSRLLAAVRPSAVFHLAGTTEPLTWKDLWEAHVTATANLLEAAKTHAPGATVVVAGSSAEYGDPGPRPARESAPCSPLGPYGASKLSQTLLSLSYGARVARVFNAIGAGTPVNLAPGSFARQIAAIERGRQDPVIRVGDLTPKRDFIDAADVAAALLAVARRGRDGEIYNVGGGRARPIREVLDGLVALATSPIAVKRAAVASHSGGLRSISADISKTRALGWSARVPFAESLARTLTHWRRSA